MPFFVTGYPYPDAVATDRDTPDHVDMSIVMGALIGTGVVLGCAVNAQATPDMTVAVDSGTVQSNSSELFVYGGNVTIATADLSLPRFDLIVVDSTGTLQVRSVDPDNSVVFPALQAGDVALAVVYVEANITEIDADNITDKRAFLPGVRYPGDIQPTARVTASAGWYMTDGAAYDRTIDASLFNAITVTTTGTFTSGSKVVTAIPSTTNFVPGAPLSGVNIAAGTVISTIDSATQITMSINATASGSASFVMAPWGVGDGSTTFNVPDSRDRFFMGPHLADNVVPVIQTKATTTTTFDANGNATVTLPTGLAAGDLLVVVLSTANGLSPWLGSGWSQIRNGSLSSTGFTAYSKIASSSDVGSGVATASGITVTMPSGTSLSATVFRITGHHPTQPIDFSAPSSSGTASSATLAVAGGTSSHANVLVITAAACSASRTQTESLGTEQSDITSVGTDTSSHATNSRTQATAGAVAANTHTYSSAVTNRAGICFGIRPAQTATIAVLGGVATHALTWAHNVPGGGALDRIATFDASTTITSIDNTPPNASVNWEIKR